MHRKVLTLLSISIAINAIILFVYPIKIYGDTLSYINHAHILLGGDLNSSIPYLYRSFGYPLILILTGVIHFETFYILIFLQFLMASVVPLLVYYILCSFNHKRAFAYTLLLIASLVPFVFMNTALTEQSFIFFILLVVFLSVRFWETKNAIYLIYQIPLLVILALIKPYGFYLGIILSVFQIFLALRKWYIPLLSIIVFISVVSFFNHYIYNIHLKGYDKSNRFGITLFLQVYLNQNEDVYNTIKSNDSFIRIKNKLLPVLTNSNYRDILYEEIEYQKTLSSTYSSLPNVYFDLFGKFENNPEALIENIYRQPNIFYEKFQRRILKKTIGIEKTDELLLALAIDLIKNNPSKTIIFTLKNIVLFSFGVESHYYNYNSLNGGYKFTIGGLTNSISTMQKPTYSVEKQHLPQSLITEVNRSWLNAAHDTSLEKVVALVYKGFYALMKIGFENFFKILKSFTFIFMLVSLYMLFKRKSKFRILALMLACMALFQVFVISFLAPPLTRYIVPEFYLEFIVAYFIVVELFNKPSVKNTINKFSPASKLIYG